MNSRRLASDRRSCLVLISWRWLICMEEFEACYSPTVFNIIPAFWRQSAAAGPLEPNISAKWMSGVPPKIIWVSDINLHTSVFPRREHRAAPRGPTDTSVLWSAVRRVLEEGVAPAFCFCFCWCFPRIVWKLFQDSNSRSEGKCSLFTTGGIKTKEASLIKFFRSTCSLFISLLNILHKKPVVGDDCSAQGARNKRFECSGRATARAETCEFIFYRLLHTASMLYKGGSSSRTGT